MVWHQKISQTIPARRKKFTVPNDSSKGKFMVLLMFQQLMMMKILMLGFFIRIWLNLILWSNAINKTKDKRWIYAWRLLRTSFFATMDQWSIDSKKWITKSMNFGNPTDPFTFVLEQPFAQATCRFHYFLISFRFPSLSLSLHGSSIDN